MEPMELFNPVFSSEFPLLEVEKYSKVGVQTYYDFPVPFGWGRRRSNSSIHGLHDGAAPYGGKCLILGKIFYKNVLFPKGLNWVQH